MTNSADSGAGPARDWTLSWLNSDGRKLLLARALRTFGYGYLAVVLAIYLQTIGLSDCSVAVQPVVRQSRIGQGRRRAQISGHPSSRGTVAKLSLLFSLDSFAGGLTVQSLVAYWFNLRCSFG